MLEQTNFKLQPGLELLGELHTFTQQLGNPDGLAYLVPKRGRKSAVRTVESLADLRAFLSTYYRHILIALELPHIFRAYHHASRNELRELIAIDSGLSQEEALQPFAQASQNVGVTQLRRLRPLRDQRLLQRFLRAVEEGETPGWHTIVYGLILSIYSLPLRQGLIHYAQQTMGGFINAVATPLRISEAQHQELHAFCRPTLAPDVEAILERLSRETEQPR